MAIPQQRVFFFGFFFPFTASWNECTFHTGVLDLGEIFEEQDSCAANQAFVSFGLTVSLIVT